MTNPPESPYGPADSTPQQPSPAEPSPSSYPPQPQPPSYPPQPQQPQQQQPAMFHPPQVPYGYTLAGPTPPKRSNGAGLAAFILGIVAVVTAFIPFVNFLAFVIGIAGIIVGIVGLVLIDRPRRMAAWGTILSGLSLVLAFVMIFVYAFGFIFAVTGAVDEATRDVPRPSEVTAPPSATPAPIETVIEVLPLGTVVQLTDDTGNPVYEATLSASVLDATDLVSPIELNPEAPDGMQWAMVTVELTSLADTTLAPAVDVSVEYVSLDGEAFSRFDAFALAPEPTLDVLFELAPGESGTGNVVLAIPTDNPTGGVWALSYGSPFGGAEQFFFEAE